MSRFAQADRRPATATQARLQAPSALSNDLVNWNGDPQVGRYPVATSQYSSPTLYQATYHTQWLFLLK
jgi:hypothetical protein